MRRLIFDRVLLVVLVGCGTFACGLVWNFDDFHEADSADGSTGDQKRDAEGETSKETGTTPSSDGGLNGHRGPWCQSEAGAATDCWDFDVPGAAVDAGWQDVRAVRGSIATTSSDRSPPSALSASVGAADGTSGAIIAALHTQAYPTTRLTVLEFDIKPGPCTTTVDQQGVVAAVLQIGDVTTQAGAWEGQIVYFPTAVGSTTAGLDLEAWTITDSGMSQIPEANACATRDPRFAGNNNYCAIDSALALDAWHHVLLRAERQIDTTWAMSVSLDGAAAINSWQVTVADMPSTYLEVGVGPVQDSSGCQAVFDNITLTTAQ